MPIVHLDGYLEHQKLVQTLPLSTLSDSRLGIDAGHYLSTLLERAPTREPLLAATGGLPLALVPRIEDDLRALEKLRIKPVFVFPGLAPARRWKALVAQSRELEDACRDRAQAWAKYEQGTEDDAFRLFEGRAGVVHADIWKLVLRVFRHRNVEFMVAPYLAWAQLIYLQRHPKNYIHAIYGPTDTLLYPGVDKVVLSLDLAPAGGAAPTFGFVSKRALLTELQVTEDQFLDMGVLCGFEHAPSFPPTLHEHGLVATRDMVKLYKSGSAAVAAYAEHPGVKQSGYHDAYARARALVRFALVLAAEGLVQPLPLASAGPAPAPPTTAADIPADLHDVYTHRLPDELYFYLSRGLLGPAPLAWLTAGNVLEPPPLDNGDATEYRRFVREVITDGQTGPRATALALVSSVCTTFWGNRKVTPLFWFEQNLPVNQHRAIQHSSQQTTQLAERIQGWTVPYALVEEELRRQNSSTIDFGLCLGATASDKLAARTRAKPAGPKITLDKKDEVVANAIWRFLELRGFLLAQHTHAPLARAMAVALRSAKLNDKFQDPLFLFLELIRAGVMSGKLLSNRAYSGGPSFGTEDEKTSMLLIMRVVSIVPLNTKAQPWSAPLSRELLVHNSFVRSLTRALRTLLEATVVNMLLRADARRVRDDYLDIALSLPFQTEVNTGFGILAKVYLDALTHMNGGQRVRDAAEDGVRESKSMALEICTETFPGVKNPAQEVERGFRFWDVALAAMRQLHSEGGVYQELIDQFEAAEAWLRPMRP